MRNYKSNFHSNACRFIILFCNSNNTHDKSTIVFIIILLKSDLEKWNRNNAVGARNKVFLSTITRVELLKLVVVFIGSTVLAFTGPLLMQILREILATVLDWLYDISRREFISKGQKCGAVMFAFYSWTKVSRDNWVAGDIRRLNDWYTHWESEHRAFTQRWKDTHSHHLIRIRLLSVVEAYLSLPITK